MEKLEINDIARLCYEVNKKWCEINGDFSQKSWEEAEEWQKESVINGVKFRLNNPDAKESAQHDKWMEYKIADGWVYGEEKDVEKKTHPCLVSFEELPEFQRKKDKLFMLVVDILKKDEIVWEETPSKEDILKRWGDIGFLPDNFFDEGDDETKKEFHKYTLAYTYENMAKTRLFLYDFFKKAKDFDFDTIVFPMIARLRTTKNNVFWEEVDALTKELRKYEDVVEGEEAYAPLRTTFNPFDLIQFFTKYAEKLWKSFEITEILSNVTFDKEAEFCTILSSLFALFMNGDYDIEKRINELWLKPFSISSNN